MDAAPLTADEGPTPFDSATDGKDDGAPYDAGDGDAPGTSPEIATPTAPADARQLAALVDRVVHQDEAAFATLYRALGHRVYRHAVRLVADMATAEEVVEDVFWQVWRQAPRYDAARGPVLAWVLQITRSRALDALRARGRHPLAMALEIDETQPGEGADPGDRLAGAQLSAQLHAALDALDPLRRQLVALAFLRGYSQAEIAEQTGLPLGTVKSHLRRALAAMKQTLASFCASALAAGPDR